MCRVGTTGPVHAPKFFKVKLCLMRWTDHKNGTIMILQVVSFIAVIFIASPNFLRANFTILGKLTTRMVLGAKRGSPGL